MKREPNSLDKYRALTSGQRKVVLGVLEYHARQCYCFGLTETRQASLIAHELLTAYGFLMLKRKGRTGKKGRKRG